MNTTERSAEPTRAGTERHTRNEDERERFEAWARRRYINVERAADGAYWHVKAHEAWQAWQASAAERHTRNEPDPESGIRISPGSSIPVERGMV